MTFRTFDIDAGHINSAAATTLTEDVTSPVRSVRSRRRARALTSRSAGSRFVGLGI